MAKDYASFRRAREDVAPRLSPDWEEFHAADLGTALMELLAHAADELSYFQDAVANEAYLETARRRTSVRRHARLVDYAMHDGASARTVVHVALEDGAGARRLPRGTQFLTRLERPVANRPPPHPAALSGTLASGGLDAAEAVFESRRAARLHPGLNAIPIHTWGDAECHLPEGATSVDLRGDFARPRDAGDGASGDPGEPHLRPGDLLLLEEVRGPSTGLEADADPSRRQLVRVTDLELLRDPGPGPGDEDAVPVTRVHWGREDALDRSFCVATRPAADDGGGGTVSELCGESVAGDEKRTAVARGNLVVADHGRRRENAKDDRRVEAPDAGREGDGGRAPRLQIQEGPLSFWAPLPDRDRPARRLVERSGHDRGRAARPPVVAERDDGAAGAGPSAAKGDGSGRAWEPIETLLEADPFDPRFVVETDDRGRARLRFGDGAFGRRPPDDAEFEVTFRTGVGPSGAVGRDALAHLVLPGSIPKGEAVPPDLPELLREDGGGHPSCPRDPPFEAVDPGLVEEVRNPVPAKGGVSPEDVQRVKRLAPQAFRAEQLRAVTEEDYAKAARGHPEISAAVAEFRWTGSWHTVFLILDPRGRTGLSEKIASDVGDRVRRVALAGYDLEVLPPRYVPLDVGLRVCVEPDHFRSDVEEAVHERLVGPRPGGSRAFFHPDRFTFGQPLYLSALLAAAEEVEGVDWVEPMRLRRFGRDAPSGAIDEGALTVGGQEVVRLEDDPSFPERGVLRLEMRGGR
jgi:hypothetical protein